LHSLNESNVRVEGNLAQAIARLDQLKQSINFAAIEAQYLSAKSELSRLQSLIKTAKELIPKSEAEIKKHNASIKTLEPTVGKLLATKDKALSKLSAIQQKLSPGRAKETALRAEIDEASLAFNKARETFHAIYEAIKD
jgi:chromosome segregation ATPase